eukprot:6622638-Prymnesium_polylepis.1
MSTIHRCCPAGAWLRKLARHNAVRGRSVKLARLARLTVGGRDSLRSLGDHGRRHAPGAHTAEFEN